VGERRLTPLDWFVYILALILLAALFALESRL
jgi:hypothetical protein